jgi:hypothetical protein
LLLAYWAEMRFERKEMDRPGKKEKRKRLWAERGKCVADLLFEF